MFENKKRRIISKIDKILRKINLKYVNQCFYIKITYILLSFLI